MCLVFADSERAGNTVNKQFLQVEVAATDLTGSIDEEGQIECDWTLLEWS